MTQTLTTQNLASNDFRIRLLIVDDEQTIRRLCMTVDVYKRQSLDRETQEFGSFCR